MAQIAFEKVEVVVHHAREVDQALNSRVKELQAKALAQGAAGILVTKHGPGRFTLELSPEVPFGYTHEKA